MACSSATGVVEKGCEASLQAAAGADSATSSTTSTSPSGGSQATFEAGSAVGNSQVVVLTSNTSSKTSTFSSGQSQATTAAVSTAGSSPSTAASNPSNSSQGSTGPASQQLSGGALAGVVVGSIIIVVIVVIVGVLLWRRYNREKKYLMRHVADPPDPSKAPVPHAPTEARTSDDMERRRPASQMDPIEESLDNQGLAMSESGFSGPTLLRTERALS